MPETAKERVAGRELDAEIEERVMGRRTFELHRDRRFTDSRNPMMSVRVPDYSTDAAAASLVESEMDQRGQLDVYAAHLCVDGASVFSRDHLKDIRFDLRDVMYAIRATPLQRCLAALEALDSQSTPSAVESAPENPDA